MQHVRSAVMVLAGLVAAAAGADKAAPKADDAILAKLDEARLAHAKAVEDAKAALSAALEKRIQAAADRGDLKGVESLTAARPAVLSGEGLPDGLRDATLSIAVLQRTKAEAAAVAQLRSAYAEAVRELTKAARLDEAKLVQEESQQFAAPSTTGVPETWSVLHYNGSEWRLAPAKSVFPPKTLPNGDREFRNTSATGAALLLSRPPVGDFRAVIVFEGAIAVGVRPVDDFESRLNAKVSERRHTAVVTRKSGTITITVDGSPGEMENFSHRSGSKDTLFLMFESGRTVKIKSFTLGK